MNRTTISLLSSALLLLTGISCNSGKEIDTQYFTLQCPSGWKAETIIEDNGPFNGINITRQSGRDIENIAMILYYQHSTDPQYMLQQQIKERMNPLMENTRSGNITDTIFKNIAAKKIKFSGAEILKGLLFSGEAVCFVNNGVTYMLLSMYPQTEPQNASKGSEPFDNLRFKKTASAPEAKDAYSSLKDYQKAITPYLPTSVTPEMKMTAFSVEKGVLTYSYRITNVSIGDFTPEEIKQWRATSAPLVLGDLKKSRNTLELIRKAMEENYTFIYEYYDRADNLLYRLTFTADDYNE